MRKILSIAILAVIMALTVMSTACTNNSNNSQNSMTASDFFESGVYTKRREPTAKEKEDNPIQKEELYERDEFSIDDFLSTGLATDKWEYLWLFYNEEAYEGNIIKSVSIDLTAPKDVTFDVAVFVKEEGSIKKVDLKAGVPQKITIDITKPSAIEKGKYPGVNIVFNRELLEGTKRLDGTIDYDIKFGTDEYTAWDEAMQFSITNFDIVIEK